MSAADRHFSPAEAAARLNVSTKALRLYEQRGLLTTTRSAAGWRTYDAGQMARAAQIASLRALGFSLAQVGRVLSGDPTGLASALAEHQKRLESDARSLTAAIATVRELRAALAAGKVPTLAELMRLNAPAQPAVLSFELPWPWGGERFELNELAPITYIVGPLGSGKTVLAMRIAHELPDAIFLDLDRVGVPDLASDPILQARVTRVLDWLVEDGATPSDALISLLATIESEAAAIVVDMVEQDLDHATQSALAAHLRRRGNDAAPLFLMTRSSAILDLESVGTGEAILHCPANHSPPAFVLPIPGAPGYEAMASCLATPEVRARTAGVVATRSHPRPENNKGAGP